MEPVFIGNGHDQYKMSDLSHYSKDIERIDNFNLWKSKVMIYCENDCISLYQVLTQFKDLVFDKWKVNINKYPTLPSLVFAIYRTHYMQENTIPITKGNIFDFIFIKESFTGGSTENYIPYGTNIHVYDVNSLYPSIMKNYLFPVGTINKFTGDISILSPDNLYWIGDVEVETKKDLYAPYLQIRRHNGNGLRTISPNGSFDMKINSPEYYNALKYYDFTINSCYFFKKGDIFSKFVTDFYNLRQQSPKSDPMNLVAKLFMNSLYGRFAMKTEFNKHEFTNFYNFKLLSEKFEITDFIDLGD
nr:DNA polymerase family B [Taiwanofungus camphoratus]WRO45216.1 DNA polymerase family B [Taiwanofungus sp. YW-2023a]